MYAITRLEEKPGVWRWAVNFRRRGRAISRSFYDLKCGGSRKALVAAIAWRDQQLAMVAVLTRRQFRQIKRSDNRSGAVGVIFLRPRGAPQGNWQARMRLPGGKKITKSFSVQKYGDRGAFRRAATARKELLRLVADSPYLRHSHATRAAMLQRTRNGD